MKTLANCNAVDFLTQTNKIRKAVAKWLTDTDIMNIRKHVPLAPDYKDKTQEEVEELQAEYKVKLQEQSKKNLLDMLDAILDEHPQETLELLGLICFVEPKDVAKMNGLKLLNMGMETISDPEVLRFFTSLVNVSQTITSVL